MKKSKLLVVLSLILIVAGLAVFGFMGFNQTVDNKECFEARIEIDQNIDLDNGKTAREVLETAAKDYFVAKNIKTADYALQKLDDGNVLVFKFNEDVKLDADAFAEEIQKNFDKDIIEVSAEYSSVLTNDGAWLVWVGASIAIALVLVFVYALIMEKLAGSVAVLVSSLLAGVLAFALTALTRLPAYPFVGVTVALSAILGAVLSISTVGKLKEEYKVATANGKVDLPTLLTNVMNGECKKYVFVCIAVLIASIALSAFIVPYLMFVGAHVLVAGLSATCGAYAISPILWGAIKGSKK